MWDKSRIFKFRFKQTSLSLDSVKPTKVESSLVSPAVIRNSAVSTAIQDEGLS